MKKLLLTLCLLLLLVPTALAAEEIAPTVLAPGEYAVTGRGKELTAWYNEVGTLKVLNYAGVAVDAGSPDTVFECLGPSDWLSGSGMHFAMGAVYQHSKRTGGTVIFGSELDKDTLTVSGVLTPYTPDHWAVTDLVDGTWTVKGGLTGAVASTEAGTLNMKGSASVRLEGWVENTAPTGYAVKLKYYGNAIALGGGASLSGGQAEIWMANGASVSATAGESAYTGNTVRLALAADFGEGVAVTEVEAESATCFSCIDPSYMLVYDSSAKTLTARKRYYTVTYDLNDKGAPSNLKPPTDSTKYANDGRQAATVLPPPVLSYDNEAHYEFLGWDTRYYGEEIAYKPGDEFAVTGDVTLYARWKRCAAALITPEGAITYYETPDAAITAAPEVATVRLLTRTTFGVVTVAEGKTITLDLNGYTAWDSNVDSMCVVEPGGSLTILGQGGGQLNGPYIKDIPYLWNKGGTLILDGGEYSGHKTVLLHEGGTTVLKSGVLLRGSDPSAHIKVVGTNATETLKGMLDEGCVFSPGLITANETDTEAVIMGADAQKTTRVLGPEAGTLEGAVINSPDEPKLTLCDAFGAETVYRVAMKKRGDDYFYTCAAPAGTYYLRNGSGYKGTHYKVELKAGEIITQNFDLRNGRVQTVYPWWTTAFLPGLTDLALAQPLEENQALLLTFGLKEVGGLPPEHRAALASLGGKCVEPYLDLTIDGGAPIRLTAPEQPEELVLNAAQNSKAVDYRVYRCSGEDAKVEQLSTSPNADGEYAEVRLRGGVYVPVIHVRHFSGEDLASRYSYAVVPVYPQPSATTYKPSIEKTAHGTVTVEPARPGYGQTVTLTLTPDEGYELDTLTVTYGKTKTVELTKKEDGTYTFRQPASAVTVTAVFRVIPPPFTDVGPADAYYEAVAFVGRAGLMNGVGEGRFAPKSTMTRAEAWVVLYRMAGVGRDDPGAPSVPWYSPAQAWAMAQGVSDGNAPDGTLTHWQFTTMLRRMGLDVSPGDDTPITRADAAMLLWQTGKIREEQTP